METRSSQRLIITACCLFALAKAQYDYTGGLPIRVPAGECPSGTVNGSITLNQNCCPEGQTYVLDDASSGGSVCCPNSSDCYETVHVAQKCADPAWALCDAGTIETQLGFCCQSGWTCFGQDATSSIRAGGVGCSAPGSSLQSYQSVVATIYKANEGPGVTTSSSTSSTSTSTSQSATSSSSTSIITAAPSATTSTIAATSSSSSSSSSGISGGAIAGIVVGAVAAIVALVGGAYMYGKRRRDRQDRYGANMAEVPGDSSALKTTYGGPPNTGYIAPSEVHSELQSERPPIELSHETRPVELYAGPAR